MEIFYKIVAKYPTRIPDPKPASLLPDPALLNILHLKYHMWPWKIIQPWVNIMSENDVWKTQLFFFLNKTLALWKVFKTFCFSNNIIRFAKSEEYHGSNFTMWRTIVKWKSSFSKKKPKTDIDEKKILFRRLRKKS